MESHHVIHKILQTPHGHGPHGSRWQEQLGRVHNKLRCRVSSLEGVLDNGSTTRRRAEAQHRGWIDFSQLPRYLPKGRLGVSLARW